MDHNIPVVMPAIHLDSAFRGCRLISRGITSALFCWQERERQPQTATLERYIAVA